MLSGVMEPFGLSKSLHMVAYYDSEYHQHVFQDGVPVAGVPKTTIRTFAVEGEEKTKGFVPG
jgi:hypothetical protein